MISKRWARLKMIWPVLRLGWQYVEDEDAWRAVDHHAPVLQYGPGCIHEFKWYMEGESRVKVTSVNDVCRWLRRCKYVSDVELFNQDDFWQHPLTFEQIRKGDCEDHALWAWRKLLELGLPAEFMVGRWLVNGESQFHAWVVFRERKQDYLLETVARTRETMLRPLSQAKPQYIPHLSVTGDLTRRIYSGLFDWLSTRRRLRR